MINNNILYNNPNAKNVDDETGLPVGIDFVFKNGKPIYTIDWLKIAQKIPVDMNEFNEFCEYLKTNHNMGFVPVNNAFNRRIKQAKKYMCKTYLENFTSVNEPLYWTIDIRNQNSISIYVLYTERQKKYTRFHATIIHTTGWLYSVETSGLAGRKTSEKIIKEKHNRLTWQTLIGGISAKAVPNDLCENWLSVDGNEKIFAERFPDEYESLSESQKYMLHFKAMQLPRMDWVREGALYTNLYHYYKADRSSAYPAEVKYLPDWHTKKIVLGKKTFEDFPEYDFVFYLKSHHFASKNEFDTQELSMHEWLWQFNTKPHFIEIPENDEITIFCKKSEDISDVMQELYYLKNSENLTESEKTIIKGQMVALIGTFESTAVRMYAANYKGFASAVIYARHIKKMIEYIEYIEKHGGIIVQLLTDCVGWMLGGPMKGITTYEKYMGCFHLEADDYIARIRGCGIYAIMNPKTQKVEVVKTQSLHVENKNIEKLEDLDEIKGVQIDLNAYKIPDTAYKYVKFIETRSAKII